MQEQHSIHVKYLELYTELKWKTHISQVCKKTKKNHTQIQIVSSAKIEISLLNSTPTQHFISQATICFIFKFELFLR